MGDAESGELGVPTTQKPSKKAPRPTAPVVVPKNAYDVQRLKLERLMEHPERPVVIPEPAKPRAPHDAPEFVRNVMGSSAGAGSGEFHVYRHLRRKEYARQKYIDQRAHEDQLDVEFRERVERNRREAEERTAKKRAKRLRRKQKAKERRTSGKTSASSGAADSSSSDDNDDGNRAPEDATSSEQTEKPAATEVAPSNDRDGVTHEANEESSGSSPEDGEERGVRMTEAHATSTLASAKTNEDSTVEVAAPDSDATISAGTGDTDHEPRRVRMITADAVDICTQAATGSGPGEPAESEKASQGPQVDDPQVDDPPENPAVGMCGQYRILPKLFMR
uniref:Protein containing DUF1168 domain n=1 Tax=Rhipicephalus zambeziensis TaxID=60191 RepID=A0A224YS10_9ACAR